MLKFILNVLCDIIRDVLNMFTTHDNILIFALWVDKGWGARKQLASIIAAEGSHGEHFFD